jgi:hypothetical protein
VYVGGTDGTILSYSDGVFDRMRTPSAGATVFGIWGSSADDAWAVGGDPFTGGGGFIWRLEDGAWRAMDLPADLGNDTFFKVWGRAADDVWIVGSDGAARHWDGAELVAVSTGTDEPLFTVNNEGEDWAAVGGFDLGVIRRFDGTATWSASALPPSTRQLFGVWLTDGGGYAVGTDATVLRREAGNWARVETGLTLHRAFHAVWVDPGGGVWAVGGDVLVPPLGEGMLAHHGAPTKGGEAFDVIDAAGDLDAGAPASDGGGRPDADGNTDAARRTTTPGFVPCAGGLCDAATDVCCVSHGDPAYTGCFDKAEGCGRSGTAIGCDESADCPTQGNRCILAGIPGGGDGTVGSVAAACITGQLCLSTDECPEGRTCTDATRSEGHVASE